MREASLAFYVSGREPPFLILHGTRDTAVPVEQSQLLYQKLSDAGVTVTLVMVENANHNFKPTGGLIKPTRTEISGLTADFFDRWLR